MYLGIIKITSKRTAMHFMDDRFVNLGVGLVRIPFFELQTYEDIKFIHNLSKIKIDNKSNASTLSVILKKEH